MGIIITSGPRAKEPPYGIVVMLECDAVEAFFCRGFETFEREDYVTAHADAMKAGWLERQSSSGRLWICPACSGKI